MHLADGQTIEVKGSASQPYVLKNTGGIYSCTCPAWRNQSAAIDRRSCKHLRKVCGDDAEARQPGSDGARSETPPRAAPAPEAPKGKAPPLLLAHPWDPRVDPSGWWMSEKLDGVRAYWDGARFLSRLGNTYAAPDWFVAGLPSFPLDGELWAGRKRFQRAVSIVRRRDAGADWEDLAFLVFDAPAARGSFEERLDVVRDAVSDGTIPHVRVHRHTACFGPGHVKAELARVEGLGGEGLMLREPGSAYEVGRSRTLLKVKSFKDDEARVVAHAPGAGKHKGRLGALVVEMADGTRFNVGRGLSDAERASPPPIGAVITFAYQELSEGGVPRFPSFLGVRHDVAIGGGR